MIGIHAEFLIQLPLQEREWDSYSRIVTPGSGTLLSEKVMVELERQPNHRHYAG